MADSRHQVKARPEHRISFEINRAWEAGPD
jgi:hypothetical protein